MASHVSCQQLVCGRTAKYRYWCPVMLAIICRPLWRRWLRPLESISTWSAARAVVCSLLTTAEDSAATYDLRLTTSRASDRQHDWRRCRSSLYCIATSRIRRRRIYGGAVISRCRCSAAEAALLAGCVDLMWCCAERLKILTAAALIAHQRRSINSRVLHLMPSSTY